MCATEVRTVRIGYQKRRAIIYVDMTIISTRVNAAISKNIIQMDEIKFSTIKLIMN